jgi:HlyD family secretion protein
MSYLRSALRFVLKFKWRFIIAAVILLPLGAILSFALSPAQPVYVTQVAEKGDLRQTVEAVGTVISERDLELQFATSGIVAQVYIKEGDTVSAGQRLAVLRAGNLSASIASAAAQLKVAEADLQAKMEGARPEDIAVSEADVASKQASLETAKISFETAEDAYERSTQKLDALNAQASTALAGDISGVSSTVSKEVTTAQNALSEVRSVFSNTDVNDAVIKYGTSEYSEINSAMNAASSQLSTLFAKPAPTGFEEALLFLDQTKAAVNQTISVVNRAFDLIGKLPETGSFTETERQAYKSDLATQRSTLQTSLNTLDAESKSLRDAAASYQTQIAAEESAVTNAKGAMNKAQADIATYQAAVNIAQAQLQLKRAPTRKTDIDAAIASVQQARASLARAQADYGNTVLTAPVAGKITKVAIKPGEFTPSGAAVTMLGNSPYRIEMYVSEIDIPKIHVTQTGSIELDAFRGTNFALRVSEIDSAATDRDGVPKYRVRLDFVYPHDELKIGMTGDAAIITGVESDVVYVPLRAVLENDEGGNYVRIMNADGSVDERDVVTGLEGEGGTVQVTGVEEGETVIVLEKK